MLCVRAHQCPFAGGCKTFCVNVVLLQNGEQDGCTETDRKRVTGWAARSTAQGLQEAGRHPGPRRVTEKVFESRSRAGAECRADRTSGLREARLGRLWLRECT